jgi:hypothetical protein
MLYIYMDILLKQFIKLFYREEEGSTFLRNVCKQCLPHGIPKDRTNQFIRYFNHCPCRETNQPSLQHICLIRIALHFHSLPHECRLYALQVQNVKLPEQILTGIWWDKVTQPDTHLNMLLVNVSPKWFCFNGITLWWQVVMVLSVYWNVPTILQSSC